MRRFSLWLRGKPFVADSLLAVALFIADAIAFVSNSSMHSWLLFVVVSIAVCVPVAWRRRHPRIVAVSVLSASLFSTFGGIAVGETENLHLSLIALPIMLYTLVAYVGRRDAAIFLVAVTVDSALALSLYAQEPISTVLFTVMMYALAWIAAEFIGARRAYDEEVEARLAVAEYDRDRRAEEAVAMERTRIARELHDVIAHSVSVMVVQADGASYAIRKDPARAEQAVANISATGRQALAELRRTVALLRTTPNADEVPLYGTAGLAKVVDMMSRAGLNVELEQTGNLDDIGPAISLGIHRLAGVVDQRSSPRWACTQGEGCSGPSRGGRTGRDRQHRYDTGRGRRQRQRSRGNWKRASRYARASGSASRFTRGGTSRRRPMAGAGGITPRLTLG